MNQAGSKKIGYQGQLKLFWLKLEISIFQFFGEEWLVMVLLFPWPGRLISELTKSMSTYQKSWPRNNWAAHEVNLMIRRTQRAPVDILEACLYFFAHGFQSIASRLIAAENKTYFNWSKALEDWVGSTSTTSKSFQTGRSDGPLWVITAHFSK